MVRVVVILVQEERTISHSYQEKIKDLISKIDTLKKEGRHLDASVCQSQVGHSFCGQIPQQHTVFRNVS